MSELERSIGHLMSFPWSSLLPMRTKGPGLTRPFMCSALGHCPTVPWPQRTISTCQILLHHPKQSLPLFPTGPPLDPEKACGRNILEALFPPLCSPVQQGSWDGSYSLQWALVGSHANGQHDEPGRANEFKTSQPLEAKGKCVPRDVYSMTLFDLEGITFFSLSLSPTPGLKWDQEFLSVSTGSQSQTIQVQTTFSEPAWLPWNLYQNCIISAYKSLLNRYLIWMDLNLTVSLGWGPVNSSHPSFTWIFLFFGR